jgi:hypothetical protein
MSRDSRQLDRSPEGFAEQLSDLDAGMQIELPKVDWSKAVAKRRAQRKMVTSIAGSVVVLCFLAPVVWFANQPAESIKGGKPAGVDLAKSKGEVRAAAARELLTLDRELSQLDRRIASINRRERSRKANLKMAKLLKAGPQVKSNFSDPVEEGALVMLAAAEKAVQKEGREAGMALYRRVVEIFPETRSAEVARRHLM